MTDSPMMTVKLTQDQVLNGSVRLIGEVLALSEKEALALIATALAVAVETATLEFSQPVETEPDEEADD